MNVTFHSWTKDDAGTIRKILYETWLNAYSSFIPKEDINRYLDQHYSITEIDKSLANPNLMGIIALVDNSPAGCIRIFYSSDEKRLYVQQLYILPEHQKYGIGRRLMEFAAMRAKLFNLDRVWLGVMVKNEFAVNWYKKMCYEITSTTPFAMGNTNVDHYIGFIPLVNIMADENIKRASDLFALLDAKTKLIYDSENSNGILSRFCKDLLAHQKTEWQWLSEGHEALKLVRIKEIVCSNYSVKLQFNPKRIASTTASTDAKAIRQRKCFLCLENLPEEQKGILYANEYLILCNPAPIFSEHFTVIHIKHIPQEFKKSVLTLLDLAKDLCPDFTVFYNGPKGGASAPDHLHFQVSPRRAMQVEYDAVDMHRRERFYYKEHVAGFTLKDYGRSVIILESSNKEKLFNIILKLTSVWEIILESAEEPIMNVLCSYQEDIWRVIIFPRTKHRPDVYFKEGDERIVVSPAAVDIGGFIVTPIEKDFERIDAKLVESIFAEVSERLEVIEQIIKAIE